MLVVELGFEFSLLLNDNDKKTRQLMLLVDLGFEFSLLLNDNAEVFDFYFESGI
jgi:hypothetical protein